MHVGHDICMKCVTGEISIVYFASHTVIINLLHFNVFFCHLVVQLSVSAKTHSYGLPNKQFTLASLMAS